MKKIIIALLFFCSSIVDAQTNICLFNPNTIPLVRIYDLNKLNVPWNSQVSITQAQYNSSVNAQNYVAAGILQIVQCATTPTVTPTFTPTCNPATTPACGNQFTPTPTPTFTPTPTATATPVPYGTVVTTAAGGTPTPVVVNNSSFTTNTILNIAPIGAPAVVFNVGNYCYICGSGACTFTSTKATTLGYGVVKY